MMEFPHLVSLDVDESLVVAGRHLTAGGGEPEKEDDRPVPPLIAGVRIVDAPVLFFVATHKALQAELAELRRMAADATNSGAYERELVVDLCRRLKFLKLVYSYQSAVEDEVIFPTLDALKNVVPAYSVERTSTGVYFIFIFHLLDLLMKNDEDTTQMFQELLFSIGTVQTIICQHMQKDEEQVFPLLVEKLTSEEQCQLVWQYMSSFPIILLEEFLPWVTLSLSFDEKLDVLHIFKLIIPKDRLLQEMVTSWIQHEERSPYDADNVWFKGYQLLNGLPISKDIHKLYRPQISCEISSVEIPIKGIHLWHAALRKDLKEIIHELCQIRTPNSCSSLSSVFVQLNFIADVLTFYSNTLDKVFYPLLNQLVKNCQSPCSPLIEECQIKRLQRLLFNESQGSAQQADFIEMFCVELESLVMALDKHLIFLETEVFPSIGENCASGMQLWLLYTNFLMMPLGLLSCTVTWFSAHLTENQSNYILKNMKLGCPSINRSFTSLLHEWVRIGCSGKNSIEKFRENLGNMFNGRSFYLAEKKTKYTVSSDQLLEQNSAIKVRKSGAIPSSSVSIPAEEDDTCYASANLLIFFSQTFKKFLPLQKNLEESDNDILTPESRPVDLIFYIHRATIKDLEYLISLSGKLAANVGFLSEFKNRFKLLHDMYQNYSNSEDEIIFPALESKGALENMSHSYCIHHKLEAKHFRRTARILNEISELQDHEDNNETRLQHYRLCLKLHGISLSMHKVLSHHINHFEAEIFPLFRGCFSIEEEEKTIGNMLGTTRVEILQEMIPWLMKCLTSDEQHAVMSLWLNLARNTKFAEWLENWWIITQKMTHKEASEANHNGEIPGQSPSYKDPIKLTFGCEHYKMNCKLVAPCCNNLYTCIRCHDGLTGHSVDKKAITKMMCMKCLVIQPIGAKCRSKSCGGFSMARYFCRICKLFDDERQIYHCPYCNLCRVGNGLGIDYFHCMRCNACSSKPLFVHECRERLLERNCPVCHSYMFISYTSLRALPCGHVMHESCFQDYICSHYICPICSKSLGDMQMYFGMLDDLLAEEKIPEEYSGQIQDILCNDCEKRGSASFHWLYHKCPHCGSYNTRLL